MKELREAAKQVGLYVDTYSPGDGVTRYRFFLEPTDYFAGNGMYTALGRKEADTFVCGFVQGYHTGINKRPRVFAGECDHTVDETCERCSPEGECAS